jgi:hypothetical protein
MNTSERYHQDRHPRAHAPASARKGWFERNWKWFVPLAVVTFLAFIAAFALLIVHLVLGCIKDMDVYKEAMNRAQSHPAVVERLGTPVEDGYFVMGNVNMSGSSGEADLSIPIRGPKGKATLYVEATRSRGVWNYDVLEVKFRDTGERLDLLGKDTGGI